MRYCVVVLSIFRQKSGRYFDYVMITSFPFLSYPLLSNHPTIRSYTLWDNDNAVKQARKRKAAARLPQGLWHTSPAQRPCGAGRIMKMPHFHPMISWRICGTIHTVCTPFTDLCFCARMPGSLSWVKKTFGNKIKVWNCARTLKAVPPRITEVHWKKHVLEI